MKDVFVVSCRYGPLYVFKTYKEAEKYVQKDFKQQLKWSKDADANHGKTLDIEYSISRVGSP